MTQPIQHPTTNFQRPSFFFTLGIACFVILFFSLGIWQVQRLAWKENLLSVIANNTNLPPEDFFAILDPVDVPSPLAPWTIIPENFKNTTIKGDFLQESYIFYVERSPRGAPGVHVLMAFMPGGSNHDRKAILVDRGWIPFDVRKHGGWQDLLGEEKNIAITGKIYFFRELSWIRDAVLPENTPHTNTFFRLDLPEIEKKLGIPLEHRAYILEETTSQEERAYPIAGPWTQQIPNNHFVYALTWFSLVLVLIVMWVLYGFHLGKKNDSSSSSS